MFFSRLRKLLVAWHYRILGILTRRNGFPKTINGFRFRIDAKYYRYHPSDYEADSFEFIRKHLKPGVVSLDIGAHFGVYAVFMQSISGSKVYSFEPASESRSILIRTLSLNQCGDRVEVLPLAVSAAPGMTTFYIAGNPVSEANSLVALRSDSSRKGYPVEITSIDVFCAERGISPGFLKIDAEGVELEILRGASSLFQRERPSGILGIHPFAYTNPVLQQETIWNLLTEYRMRITSAGKAVDREWFVAQTGIFDIHFEPLQ